MPTAIASCRRSAFALIGILALQAGCSSANGTGDDAGADNGPCTPAKNAHGPGSAEALGMETATGTICPRGTQNWYSLTVPPGADLLDVTVGYPSATTKVAVLAQLFSTDGTTPVPDGEIVDTRTGARKGTVGSTIRVPAPGDYRLVVRDAANGASDSLNSYVLTVATAKDPDTHEPNDTLAQAKAADGQPGWLAYRNDHDLYQIAVPANDVLLDITVANPAASQTVLHYALQDGAGKIVGEGDAGPNAKPLEALRLLPTNSGGTYVVAVSLPADAPPDRRPASGYTVSLVARPELDPNDQGGRNDSGATAVCLNGPLASSMCSTPYAGGDVTWHQGGQIGSLGDRDYFRIDVAQGAPAVVEIDARMGATAMQLAVDLLVPEPGSVCTSDSACAAVNLPCNDNSDCELSHSCLPAAVYNFCANGQPCRLCAGASACVPSGPQGGSSVCAQPQYLIHDTASTAAVRTAQPVLATGTYYIVVHDYQDDGFDYGNSYTLDVRVSPEPDPGDQSPTAALRNNFYNPYPMDGDDLSPSQRRAHDITANLMAGLPTSGYISYQSDEDWFSFQHPCPGMNCGLVFEWVQPGPSPVRGAYLMRRDDQQIHESWTYTGATATTMLVGPVTSTFGAGDCHECSFASQMYMSTTYYMQVRDVGSKHWDSSPSGAYSFRLKAVTPGCPANCSEGGTQANPVCGCYCKALNQCPPSPAL